MVGVRLIVHAGNLAFTVQILGAEKALIKVICADHHFLRCYSLYFTPIGFYRVLRTYQTTKYNANHSSIGKCQGHFGRQNQLVGPLFGFCSHSYSDLYLLL